MGLGHENREVETNVSGTGNKYYKVGRGVTEYRITKFRGQDGQGTVDLRLTTLDKTDSLVQL